MPSEKIKNLDKTQLLRIHRIGKYVNLNLTELDF